MSRPEFSEKKFNQDKYLKLIEKAKGNRTQCDFARDAEISQSYLNTALKKKFPRPFRPDILRKIAAASENRVTFKELLDVAGYDYRKYMTIDDVNAKCIEVKPENLASEKYLFMHTGNYIVEFDSLDALKKYYKKNKAAFTGAMRLFHSISMAKGYWTYEYISLGDITP